jgi:hypothetical protein
MAGVGLSATADIWSTDPFLPDSLVEAKVFAELSGGISVKGGYTGKYLTDETTVASTAYGGVYGYVNFFLGCSVDVASGLFSVSLKGGAGASYRGIFKGETIPAKLELVENEAYVGELKVRYDASCVWGVYQYREEYILFEGFPIGVEEEILVVPFTTSE